MGLNDGQSATELDARYQEAMNHQNRLYNMLGGLGSGQIANPLAQQKSPETAPNSALLLLGEDE